MGKIFDMNNPVWQFIGKLVDCTVLHIIWLVCCIPVFTIGPATIALHYAMMKDVADEDAHYVKAFFRSFKQNFKQGVALGLIYLLVGAGLAFAIYFYSIQDADDTFYSICRGVTIAFSAIFAFSSLYVYPLMARFENTVIGTIKNSMFMSAKHIGWTLLMALILVAPYAVIYFTNFLPLFVMGYGLVVYLNSYILNHVFKKYIEAEKPPEDPDEWTIPEDEQQAMEELAMSGYSPIPKGYMDEAPANAPAENTEKEEQETESTNP